MTQNGEWSPFRRGYVLETGRHATRNLMTASCPNRAEGLSWVRRCNGGEWTAAEAELCEACLRLVPWWRKDSLIIDE